MDALLSEGVLSELITRLPQRDLNVMREVNHQLQGMCQAEIFRRKRQQLTDMLRDGETPRQAIGRFQDAGVGIGAEEGNPVNVLLRLCTFFTLLRMPSVFMTTKEQLLEWNVGN